MAMQDSSDREDSWYDNALVFVDGTCKLVRESRRLDSDVSLKGKCFKRPQPEALRRPPEPLPRSANVQLGNVNGDGADGTTETPVDYEVPCTIMTLPKGAEMNPNGENDGLSPDSKQPKNVQHVDDIGDYEVIPTLLKGTTLVAQPFAPRGAGNNVNARKHVIDLTQDVSPYAKAKAVVAPTDIGVILAPTLVVTHQNQNQVQHHQYQNQHQNQNQNQHQNQHQIQNRNQNPNQNENQSQTQTQPQKQKQTQTQTQKQKQNLHGNTDHNTVSQTPSVVQPTVQPLYASISSWTEVPVYSEIDLDAESFSSKSAPPLIPRTEITQHHTSRNEGVGIGVGTADPTFMVASYAVAHRPFHNENETPTPPLPKQFFVQEDMIETKSPPSRPPPPSSFPLAIPPKPLLPPPLPPLLPQLPITVPPPQFPTSPPLPTLPPSPLPPPPLSFSSKQHPHATHQDQDVVLDSCVNHPNRPQFVLPPPPPPPPQAIPPRAPVQALKPPPPPAAQALKPPPPPSAPPPSTQVLIPPPTSTTPPSTPPPSTQAFKPSPPPPPQALKPQPHALKLLLPPTQAPVVILPHQNAPRQLAPPTRPPPPLLVANTNELSSQSTIATIAFPTHILKDAMNSRLHLGNTVHMPATATAIPTPIASTPPISTTATIPTTTCHETQATSDTQPSSHHQTPLSHQPHLTPRGHTHHHPPVPQPRKRAQTETTIDTVDANVITNVDVGDVKNSRRHQTFANNQNKNNNNKNNNNIANTVVAPSKLAHSKLSLIALMNDLAAETNQPSSELSEGFSQGVSEGVGEDIDIKLPKPSSTSSHRVRGKSPARVAKDSNAFHPSLSPSPQQHQQQRHHHHQQTPSPHQRHQQDGVHKNDDDANDEDNDQRPHQNQRGECRDDNQRQAPPVALLRSPPISPRTQKRFITQTPTPCLRSPPMSPTPQPRRMKPKDDVASTPKSPSLLPPTSPPTNALPPQKRTVPALTRPTHPPPPPPSKK